VYEMRKGRGFFLIAAGMSGAGGSVGADYNRLLFEFDSTGVLTRWEMERAGGPTDTPLPNRKQEKQAGTAVTVEPAVELKKLPADQWALKGSKSFRSVALSPDGALLAATDSKGRVWLRDLASGAETTLAEPKLFGPLRRTTSVLEFSRDGQRLAVMSQGVQVVDPARRMHIDLPRAQTKRELKDSREATAMALAPDGRLIAMGNLKGTLRVIDPDRDSTLHSIQAHKKGIASVAYSPDGGLLATAGWDASVRIWSTATWEEIAHLPVQAGVVRFSPDGSMLALFCDAHVEIWRLHDRDTQSLATSGVGMPMLEQVFLVPHYIYHGITGLQGLQMTFSKDGRYLAAPVGSCVVYDTSTRQIVWRYLPRGRQGEDAITSWVFAPDGRRAAIATPKTIYWIEEGWQRPASSSP